MFSYYKPLQLLLLETWELVSSSLLSPLLLVLTDSPLPTPCNLAQSSQPLTEHGL